MGRPAQTPLFELSGGSLGLDFANTWEDRGRPETDKLRSYPDLLAFACQTGILDAGEARALAAQAARRAAAAARALAAARRLRDAIYRVFSDRAAGRSAENGDLERLSAACAAAARRLRLEPAGEAFTWSWRDLEQSLDAPLGPIAHSAAELLTTGDLDRLRECHGSRCTWLFLDASRNRSRRWCSMDTCGNRAKARRHYHRRQASGG